MDVYFTNLADREFKDWLKSNKAAGNPCVRSRRFLRCDVGAKEQSRFLVKFTRIGLIFMEIHETIFLSKRIASLICHALKYTD